MRVFPLIPYAVVFVRQISFILFEVSGFGGNVLNIWLIVTDRRSFVYSTLDYNLQSKNSPIPPPRFIIHQFSFIS